MKKVVIYKVNGEVISGEVKDIEFEGTDGGYPIYTAIINGEDGTEYMAAVSSENPDKISDQYVQEEFGENWIYSD